MRAAGLDVNPGPDEIRPIHSDSTPLVLAHCSTMCRWCICARAAQKLLHDAACAAGSGQHTFMCIGSRIAACTRHGGGARGGNPRTPGGVCWLLPCRRQRQVDGPPLRIRHDDVGGRPARLQLHMSIDITAWHMVFACSGSVSTVHGRCKQGSTHQKKQAVLAAGSPWLSSKIVEWLPCCGLHVGRLPRHAVVKRLMGGVPCCCLPSRLHRVDTAGPARHAVRCTMSCWL